MSDYFYRDGQLFTTKTMCNLVEFWQHEARVYPDEWKQQGIREFRSIIAGLERFDSFVAEEMRNYGRR